MSSRRSIIVVEDFYRDAQAVRIFAVRLRCYTPCQDLDAVESGVEPAKWWASWFRLFDECPFKSSNWLIDALEHAVGETIDMEHLRASFPVDAQSKPLSVTPGSKHACLWNCCFHVKHDNGQPLGEGVHNHVTDGWNSVEPPGLGRADLS